MTDVNTNGGSGRYHLPLLAQRKEQGNANALTVMRFNPKALT